MLSHPCINILCDLTLYLCTEIRMIGNAHGREEGGEREGGGRLLFATANSPAATSALICFCAANLLFFCIYLLRLSFTIHASECQVSISLFFLGELEAD